MPYGKRLAADGKTLQPCPVEGPVVEFVNMRRDAGLRPKAISRELAALGHFSRNGKPFVSQQIIRMFNHPQTTLFG